MSEESKYVDPTAEAMSWAVQKARLTSGYFRESLAAPSEQQDSFSMKARIRDGEKEEHLWLSDVQMDEEGIFYGIVKNQPEGVENVQQGTRIGVGPGDLTDWMIVENGRLIGGYTIRVVRDRMSPAQRDDFDVTLGLRVDEGVDYFPHNHTTPEGAILCLEDAFTQGDINAAVACKDFQKEASHMLGRVPNLELTPDVISQTAETLEMAFRNFFVDHGMPNYSGTERAFTEREFEDDDTVVITEFCRHPDGTMTADRIWVYRINGLWKVGPPANEDL